MLSSHFRWVIDRVRRIEKSITEPNLEINSWKGIKMDSFLHWENNIPPLIEINGIEKRVDFIPLPQNPTNLAGFWIAKLGRHTIGKPQIIITRFGPQRIKKTWAGTLQTYYEDKLIIIVSLCNEIKIGYLEKIANVAIKTNGAVFLNFRQYEEMKKVVNEAIYILEHLAKKQWSKK